MLTLATGTLESLDRRLRFGRYKVSYKLRYWDIEAQAYTWQSSWTELYRDEVESVSSIRDELDRDTLTEFRTSNVSVSLKNKRNVWSVQNPNGLLKADSTARKGYVLYRSRFKIEKIYEYDDGTEGAAVSEFDGYVSAPSQFYPDLGTVVLVLESKRAILADKSAERACTLYADETLGTGDGVTTAFTTAHNGVIRFVSHEVDGIPMRTGIDLDESQMADPDLPGKITFTEPPSTGEVVTASYRVGPIDQKIEDLVSLLGTTGGLTAGEMDIEVVTYAHRVINRELYTTKAQWETGTLSQLDSDLTDGSIGTEILVDDFADNDFTANPAWTGTLPGGGASTAGWTAAAGKLTYTGNVSLPSPSMSLASTRVTGAWEYKFRHYGATDSGPYSQFAFMASTNDVQTYQGYCVYHDAATSQLFLYRVNAGVYTAVASCAWGRDTAEHTIRVTRETGGVFNVYYDGVAAPILTGTDNTYTTSSYMFVQVVERAGTLLGGEFDDIRESYGTGTWISPVIDGGADFLAPLRVALSSTVPSGCTVAVSTASSASNGGPWSYTAVDSCYNVQSSAARYWKVKLELTSPLTETGLKVASCRFTWSTSTARVSLANFAGMSCDEAISALSKLSAYEWGFDRSGVLYFRPRPTADTTVDFTLENRHIVRLTPVSDGTDRVYNRIISTYGSYSVVVDSASRGESAPTSQDTYGDRELSVGESSLMLDPDADVATGLGYAYYDYFSKPRRVYEVDCRHLPQIELGDILRLRYRDSEPSNRAHVGDNTSYMGQAGLRCWGHEQQSAFDITARVIACEHGPHDEASRFVLEEVI